MQQGQSSSVGHRQSAAALSQLLTRWARSISASTSGSFRVLQGQELAKCCWRHPDGGCRECGAHLFSRNPDDPNPMSVRLAAFDGDPGIRPTWRALVAYTPPWEPIPDGGLERYEEGKPR